MYARLSAHCLKGLLSSFGGSIRELVGSCEVFRELFRELLGNCPISQ